MPSKIELIIKILVGLIKPLRVTWGWLAALFLLCTFQGWLLSISSLAMFFSFGAIVWLVSKAIAAKSIHTGHYTDFTYFRVYPVAANRGIKTITLVWAGLVGWNWADVAINFWSGAIDWQIAIALAITSFIVTAITWIWVTVAAVVGQKLADSKNRFWLLAGSSWAGMIIGIIIL
jgi:hypothetical protein